jgi:hypothetical protein
VKDLIEKQALSRALSEAAQASRLMATASIHFKR